MKGRSRSLANSLISALIGLLVACFVGPCRRTNTDWPSPSTAVADQPTLMLPVTPTDGHSESPLTTPAVDDHFLSPLATPTPDGAFDSPLPTPTPGPPTATPTPTPTPSPTPTYPPYTDAPFKMVFLRDGDLWLSEIGGEGEWRLTDEPAGWSVREYAVSPACDRIAYIPRRQDTRDAAIKRVDLDNGKVSALVGLDDRANEYGVRWLDQDHLLFHRSFFPMIVDLRVHEFANVDGYNLWQSDDGRYQVVCFACGQGYAYECGCSFRLRDWETGQEWHIAQDVTWGNLLGWSSNSEWAVFTSGEYGAPLDTKLVAVDMATRSSRVITPDDKTVVLSGWSPDRRHIAFTMCDRRQTETEEGVQDCDLWLVDPDGSHARLVLDGRDDHYILFAAWSPDGQTLAFRQCSATEEGYPFQPKYCGLGLVGRDGSDLVVILGNIPAGAIEIKWHPDGSRLLLIESSAYVNTVPMVWSVRADGTDLRPIINDAGDAQVLCEP